MYSKLDHEYMSIALKLAERGHGTTHPNPMVGCVLVKDAKIVGEGWHEKAGLPHAEANALKAAGSKAQGSTAYVTLEPCSHSGRTPPCSEALIDAGVSRVIYATRDPNPQIAGTGHKRLTDAELEVGGGLLEEQSRQMNRGFMSRFERGRPWVVTKVAASLDGKTALANGESQWITGTDARTLVHQMRAAASAVLTGSGTILQDNPSLTVRHVPNLRAPMRVVLDTHLRTPPQAKLFESSGNVLIFHACDDKHLQLKLVDAGARLILVPTTKGKLDLLSVFEHLAQEQVNEVLVEAGATLNGALLAEGLIDELVLFIAPCLLGGTARSMFALPMFETLESRVSLGAMDVRKVGEDWLVRARVNNI